MKKIITALIVIFLVTNAVSQVIITPQLPQTGIKLKTQLWNLGLSNSNTVPISVKLSMVMTDLSNGQQVLSALTELIQLPQGVKLIQYNDVVPVNYVVINNIYNIDVSPNGFLPIGNFDICFEVLKPVGEIMESVAEECIQIEVEPLSPPYLNLPADKSEIDEPRPLFSWIPPSAAIFFTNLSYDFKLVEVLANQNPDDAIQQNIPLVIKSNHYGISFQYPASIATLDTGKTYAWQVAANNNGLFIAKSEVWVFKEKASGFDNVVYQRETPYFRLKQEASNAYFLCNGTLKFEYQNEVNDNIVSFAIYDVTTKEKNKIQLPQNNIEIKFGQNFIDYNIKEVNGIINGHFYQVELVNSKNENWSGKFEYKLNN
jgi:hypothetical protein